MNGEFVMVSKSFIERLPELSGGAVKVYLALLSHSKKSEGVVWPSMDRLSTLAGHSKRHTASMIAELVESGIIERVGQAGRCNKYKISPPEPMKDISPMQSTSSTHEEYFMDPCNPLHGTHELDCTLTRVIEPESLTRIKNKNPLPPKGDEISFSPLMDDLSEKTESHTHSERATERQTDPSHGSRNPVPLLEEQWKGVENLSHCSSNSGTGKTVEQGEPVSLPNSLTVCSLQPSASSLQPEASNLLQQLNSIPRFADAWEMWERHLSEKKTKRTPTARLRQLKDLLAWETERAGSAILALETAIRCNWNGLFKQEKHEQPLKPHQRNLQGSQLQHVSEPHPDRVKWLEENRPKPREVGKMRPGGF